MTGEQPVSPYSVPDDVQGVAVATPWNPDAQTADTAKAPALRSKFASCTFEYPRTKAGLVHTIGAHPVSVYSPDVVHDTAVAVPLYPGAHVDQT